MSVHFYVKVVYNFPFDLMNTGILRLSNNFCCEPSGFSFQRNGIPNSEVRVSMSQTAEFLTIVHSDTTSLTKPSPK